MFARIDNISIKGVTTALPKKVVEFKSTAVGRRSSNPTGVKRAHVVEPGVCSSDLAVEACENLIEKLSWGKESIDGIIFLSQTPDYIVPATACLLQDRLNLPKSVMAFDVNQGCSGYLYGLYIASSLLQENGPRRILLVVGDTSSRLISETDESVNRLFGDAVCATALEYSQGANSLNFILGTDGGSYKSLCVPSGGFRNYVGSDPKEYFLRMNGPEIFSFALRTVPLLVDSMIERLRWDKHSVDVWLMHQASVLVLNALIQKIGVDKDRVITSFENYGNTSSASIPLTMTQSMVDFNGGSTGGKRFIMLGFGAGNSWGGLGFDCYDDILLSSVLV